MLRGGPGVIVRVDNISPSLFSRPVEGQGFHLLHPASVECMPTQTTAISAAQATGELTRALDALLTPAQQIP
jgi:hypothetical protein